MGADGFCNRLCAVPLAASFLSALCTLRNALRAPLQSGAGSSSGRNAFSDFPRFDRNRTARSENSGTAKTVPAVPYETEYTRMRIFFLFLAARCRRESGVRAMERKRLTGRCFGTTLREQGRHGVNGVCGAEDRFGGSAVVSFNSLFYRPTFSAAASVNGESCSL